MTAPPGVISPEETHGLMEVVYTEQYLQSKGLQLEELSLLPAEEAYEVLCEAHHYASSKLAELEQRARFMNELHESVHLAGG